jgi:hypothetical protein
LQKALQREKEKSDYSRRYAEKHFPIGKKPEPIEEPKKTVAEGSGGAKYKIKQIGAEGGKDFYISPNTGKKVYKKVNVGDHETPAGDHKPKIRMPYKEDVAEVTKQSAIKQYKDIQNYKHVDKPKKDEKEFIKITLSNPKKQGAVEGQDSCVKVNESIEHKMSKLISILKNK